MAEPSPRLLQGGSWFSKPHSCRAACRGLLPPGYFSGLVGFRVVCPDPTEHAIPLKETYG